MCRQLDAGQSTLLIEVIKRDLFIYLFISEGLFSPDFRSNKSKSGSFIIIAYPWPMEIKLGYESGVVTICMRLGRVRVPFNIAQTFVALLAILCVKRATFNL